MCCVSATHWTLSFSTRRRVVATAISTRLTSGRPKSGVTTGDGPPPAVWPWSCTVGSLQLCGCRAIKIETS